MKLDFLVKNIELFCAQIWILFIGCNANLQLRLIRQFVPLCFNQLFVRYSEIRKEMKLFVEDFGSISSSFL